MTVKAIATLTAGICLVSAAGCENANNADEQSAPGTGSADWQTYSNDRYGFRLSYPDTLFTRIGRAQNGDGAVLRGSDGDPELRVYASHGVSGVPAGDTVRIDDVIDTLRDGLAAVDSVERRMNYAIVHGTGSKGDRRVAFGQVVHPDNVIYFLKLSHAGDKLERDGIDRIIDSFHESVNAIATEEPSS